MRARCVSKRGFSASLCHFSFSALCLGSKLPQRWLAEGKRHVVFFQDTNALAFLALPGCLGVSLERGLEVNTMTIPRRAGQEMGAIAELRRADGSEGRVVANVEYNQLAPALLAQSGRGDEPDEAPKPAAAR